jgi:hypothetical protein
MQKNLYCYRNLKKYFKCCAKKVSTLYDYQIRLSLSNILLDNDRICIVEYDVHIIQQ